MFKIITKQILKEGIYKIGILAPEIAKKFISGQSIIIMPNQYSRRIVVTSVYAKNDLLILVIKDQDASTKALANLKINETAQAILGPLGKGLDPLKKKTILCLSEGRDVATILPVAHFFKESQNKVIGLAAFHSRKELILESQLRQSCQKAFLATVDGSYERRGSILDILISLLEKERAHVAYMDISLESLKTIKPLLKKKRIKAYFNLVSYLSKDLNFSDLDYFEYNEEVFSLYYDRAYVDVNGVDLDVLEKKVNIYKEFNSCQNKCLTSNSRISESKILPKLFSVFEKIKP